MSKEKDSNSSFSSEKRLILVEIVDEGDSKEEGRKYHVEIELRLHECSFIGENKCIPHRDEEGILIYPWGIP